MKEEYKFEGHVWFMNKNAGKQVCAYCGLVLLRNEATAWCVARGCNYALHPSYPSTMKRLTKFFKD